MATLTDVIHNGVIFDKVLSRFTINEKIHLMQLNRDVHGFVYSWFTRRQKRLILFLNPIQSPEIKLNPESLQHAGDRKRISAKYCINSSRSVDLTLSKPLRALNNFLEMACHVRRLEIHGIPAYQVMCSAVESIEDLKSLRIQFGLSEFNVDLQYHDLFIYATEKWRHLKHIHTRGATSELLGIIFAKFKYLESVIVEDSYGSLDDANRHHLLSALSKRASLITRFHWTSPYRASVFFTVDDFINFMAILPELEHFEILVDIQSKQGFQKLVDFIVNCNLNKVLSAKLISYAEGLEAKQLEKLCLEMARRWPLLKNLTLKMDCHGDLDIDRLIGRVKKYCPQIEKCEMLELHRSVRASKPAISNGENSDNPPFQVENNTDNHRNDRLPFSDEPFRFEKVF